MIIYSTNGVEKIGCPPPKKRKMNLNHYLSPYAKVDLEYIIVLNLKMKTES